MYFILFLYICIYIFFSIYYYYFFTKLLKCEVLQYVYYPLKS